MNLVIKNMMLKLTFVLSVLLVSNVLFSQNLFEIVPLAFEKKEHHPEINKVGVREVTVWKQVVFGDSLSKKTLVSYQKLNENKETIEYSRNGRDTILLEYNDRGDWVIQISKNIFKNKQRNVLYNESNKVESYTVFEEDSYNVFIEYDKLNRPIKKRVGTDIVYEWSYYDNSNVSFYKKNVNGNLTEIREFFYDNEKLSSCKVSYYYDNKLADVDSLCISYNVEGKPSQMISYLDKMTNNYFDVMEVFYDSTGRVFRTIFSNKWVERNYSENGYLESIVTFNNQGKLIAKMTYEYVFFSSITTK